MKIKKALIWSVSSIVILFFALVFTPLGHLFVIVAGSSQVNFEIPQKIGGKLVVAGEEWMDVQSFGDLTNISFKPENSVKEYSIGKSDYYGRSFNNKKQINHIGDIYLLVVGDRLNGDKIYASKDLKNWKGFTFSRESILELEKENSQVYLPRYWPDKIFINENVKSAEWIRRIGKGADLKAQKLRFTFSLDWMNNKIICTDIIEIIDDVDFKNI